MTLLILLINTMSYGCACMGLVGIETFMWLLKKGKFLHDDEL